MASASSESTEKAATLNASQRARSEKNRQRALLLKQARLASRPYPDKNTKSNEDKANKVIDSGAGFFISEDEGAVHDHLNVVHPPGAILDTGDDTLFCDECEKEFVESYIYTKFNELVCDNCRDSEDKHRLISKTEAKTKYLLKDCDFEKRDPPLQSIVKKNPHNSRWGDMKLYLESQVANRALQVWGSEESLEEQRQKKEDNKEKVKQKKFDKKVKELRMAVRSSLWKKETGPHEHDYGPESYNDEEDTYSKTCSTCGNISTYEKM